MELGFEGNLLVFRVLIPLTAGVLGLILLTLWSNAKAIGKGFIGWLLALGFLFLGLSYLISEFGFLGAFTGKLDWEGLKNWFLTPPKEPWMRLTGWFPVLLGLFMFGHFFSHHAISRFVGWGILAAIMFGTFMGLLPGTQGYEDKAPLMAWLPWAVVLSTLCNALLTIRKVESVDISPSDPSDPRAEPSHRPNLFPRTWFLWTFVVQLGAIAACILQGYASLGEWAIVTATLALAIASLGTALRIECGNQTKHPYVPVSFTLAFTGVALLGVSQVYTWSPLPLWFLFVLAFLPSLLALIDESIITVTGLISLRHTQKTPLRVAGWLISIFIFGLLLYWFVLRSVPEW